jgi:signal transduction histidine kinase
MIPQVGRVCSRMSALSSVSRAGPAPRSVAVETSPPDDAGALVHEFNNLLARLLGASEQLVEALPAGSEHQALARLCLEVGVRSAQLLPRIRAASAEPHGRVETLDGGSLLEGLARYLRPIVRESVRIRTAARGDLLCISDRSQLERALVTLAINALQGMPDGGVLRLACEAVRVGPAQAMRLRLDPGRYVAFTVRGAGAGAPRDGVGMAETAEFARHFLGALELGGESAVSAAATLYTPARD